MRIDTEEIVALLQLQQFDMELLRAQKKLDELPQRERILKLRDKKKNIQTKRNQVLELRKTADHELSRINDEDGRLVLKQQEVQDKIDRVQGDYRAVESLTKELSGIAKRRNTLEADLVPLGEKISQISGVQNQVDDALSLVEKQEAEAIASFQKEGGELTNDVARLQACREAAAKKLSVEVLDTYQKKAKRGGGIGVSRLVDGVCSVCRNRIDEGKLLQVKTEAPLSECPSCKRMMVVVNE